MRPRAAKGPPLRHDVRCDARPYAVTVFTRPGTGRDLAEAETGAGTAPGTEAGTVAGFGTRTQEGPGIRTEEETAGGPGRQNAETGCCWTGDQSP